MGEESSDLSPEDVLGSRDSPLLLIFDEAQRLGKKSDLSYDHATTATALLEIVHNGYLKRPLILLAAGLGGTTECFSSFGISSFGGDCEFELGGLSHAAECAVIHDWLTDKGKAKEDPTEWINAIAERANGWPQHIMGYVGPALDQLHESGGSMTAEGLKSVIIAGDQRREAFYKRRVKGVMRTEMECITRPFAGLKVDDPVRSDKILASLQTMFSVTKAEHIFYQAIAKGVLDERDGMFVIPIPSMHSWMVEKYARA